MPSAPWFVGGGAEHSPEIARLLAYAGTSGAEGIVTPLDYKVSALAVPAGEVRIAPGAGLLLNRSTGGGQQTYVTRRATEERLPIAATGSAGGRSDLIVQRVEDPQYAPWQPPTTPEGWLTTTFDPFVVIQGVPAGTRTAAALNLGYPAIALARVDVPASTGTITDAMITDLRKVALPRAERQQEIGLPGADRNTGGDGTWVNLVSFASVFEVPTWATTALVTMTASGLEHLTGNFLGDIRANFLAAYSQDTVLDLNWTGNPARYTYAVGGRFAVPLANRGTSVALNLQGRRRTGTGVLQADAGVTVIADVTFQETAA